MPVTNPPAAKSRTTIIMWFCEAGLVHVKTGITFTSTHKYATRCCQSFQFAKQMSTGFMWNILVCKSWIFPMFSCCLLCSRHCVRYVSGNVTGSTTNKIPHLPETYILSTSLRFETWLTLPHTGNPLCCLGRWGSKIYIHMYFRGRTPAAPMCNPVHRPGAKVPERSVGARSASLPLKTSSQLSLRQEVYPFLLISQFPPSNRILGQT